MDKGTCERDPLFEEAVEILKIFKESNDLKGRRFVEVYKIRLQRELRIGYNRAYAIILQISDAGYIDLPKRLKINEDNRDEFCNRKVYNPQLCETESSGVDPLFEDAAIQIIKKNSASTSNIQRTFGIGYNRSYKIMEQLEKVGIIGPAIGIKPRDILMDMERFEKYLQEFNKQTQS